VVCAGGRCTASEPASPPSVPAQIHQAAFLSEPFPSAAPHLLDGAVEVFGDLVVWKEGQVRLAGAKVEAVARQVDAAAARSRVGVGAGRGGGEMCAFGES